MKSHSHSKSRSKSNHYRKVPLRFRARQPGVGGHCPPGMLMRKAYTAKRRSKSRSRSISYRVRARCVRGSGADPSHHVPKKNRVIPKLKKGTLSSKGYSVHESSTKRHIALRKAVKAHGYRVVMGKVNAVYVLNRNKPSGKIFGEDKAWLKRTFNP